MARPNQKSGKTWRPSGEFLPKKKVVDPFSELAAKQKKERQEREAEAGRADAGSSANAAESKAAGPAGVRPTPSTPPPLKPGFPSPAPTVASSKPAPVEGSPSAEPLKLKPRPTQAPTRSKVAGATETGAEEAEETVELKTGKAEAVKNAIIQAAGSWGFTYKTEFEILGGRGKVDIFLELGDRRLVCEISATTNAEQEVDHLLNCLTAGFLEIVSVCDATYRRQRIESLLLSRIIPGQETLFHFLTTHQLQTRLADIGQAAQKSGLQRTGGKAATAAVTITRDEQAEIATRQFAEIAERRAKARAAKAAKG